jgi:hypothetical protein
MTQQQINECFESDLGQQLDVLYSTSDDRVFIRYYEEAVAHTEGRLDDNTQPLLDKTIIEWYPEDEYGINDIRYEKLKDILS